MWPATEYPAELAANEHTGEPLAPETDMLVEGEEGLGEIAAAKVLRGLEQPTAAEIEQHEPQVPTVR
eukprot:1296429-Amphidinium_carterae.1